MLSATVFLACAADVKADELLQLPKGRIVGGSVRDNGTGMIAVAQGHGREEGTTFLVYLNRLTSRTATVPSDNAMALRFLADGRFVLTNCVPLSEGDNHCDRAYQVYGLDEAGTPQLDWE